VNEYGISLTGRYYGIFSKRQARKRVRKINHYIRMKKREQRQLVKHMGTGRGFLSTMRGGMQSPNIHKIANNKRKIAGARERKRNIQKRWGLGGRKRKRGYKLFRFG